MRPRTVICSSDSVFDMKAVFFGDTPIVQASFIQCEKNCLQGDVTNTLSGTTTLICSADPQYLVHSLMDIHHTLNKRNYDFLAGSRSTGHGTLKEQ